MLYISVAIFCHWFMTNLIFKLLQFSVTAKVHRDMITEFHFVKDNDTSVQFEIQGGDDRKGAGIYHISIGETRTLF